MRKRVIIFFALISAMALSGYAAEKPMSEIHLPSFPWYLNQSYLWPGLVVMLIVALTLRSYHWRKRQAELLALDQANSGEAEEESDIDNDGEDNDLKIIDDSQERSAKSGFTLVELLVVIAIIMILTGIGMSNYMGASIRAKVTACKANMRTVEMGIVQYKNDFGSYPAFYRPDSQGGNYTPNRVIVPMVRRLSVLTTPVSYITQVPRDPFPVRESSPSGPVTFFDTFDYADADSLASFGNVIGGLTSGGKWRLASPGPDQILAFGGYAAENGPTTSNKIGVDYDPTNGVISLGDVVRVGDLETRGTPPAIRRIPDYAELFWSYPGH